MLSNVSFSKLAKAIANERLLHLYLKQRKPKKVENWSEFQ